MDTLKLILSNKWINLAALERATGCPRGSLEAFTSGRKGLAKKNREKVTILLVGLLRELNNE